MENNFSLKEFLRYRKNDAKKLTAAVLTLGVVLMLTGKGEFFGTKKKVLKPKTAKFYRCREMKTKKNLKKYFLPLKEQAKLKL